MKMTELKQQLWSRWKFEFEAWMPTFQSAPVELIISKDHSSGYEMDRMHIFKLENNTFVVVKEEGCSCYSPGQAKIELFGTLRQAKNAWNRNIENDSWNDKWLGDKL